MPDGSQAWAEVREGEIVNGGRNDRPRKWAPGNPKHGGHLKDFYDATKFSRLSGRTPATRSFHQLLQQTYLTRSYNSNHPNHPVPAKGASSGQIGGVGHKLGIIEGLFDNPESIFDEEHYFMVPFRGGKMPFSNRELQRLLRELAIGIYAHEEVPFFSLEFNQEGHLFPAIHPVYENTLVGKVIGMLDYMMKGYLNGGTFSEEFIYGWKNQQGWTPQSAFSQFTDFWGYCRENLPEGEGYQPLSNLIVKYTEKEKLKLLRVGKNSPEPEIFSDYTKFTNSFRIIAKQSSFKKSDNLFVLDSDFHVYYTLEPDPAYKETLEKGAQKMCTKIHDHMQKFPPPNIEERAA